MSKGKRILSYDHCPICQLKNSDNSKYLNKRKEKISSRTILSDLQLQMPRYQKLDQLGKQC